MAILTVAQLKQMFDPDRIEQLATDGSLQFGSNKYNEDVVKEILTQAEGVVKNSLGRQYTNAQIEADEGVRRITADIAMFYLEMRRPPVKEAATRTYQLTLKLLEQLQTGEAKLAAVSQLLPTGPTEVPTEATDSGYFD